MFRVDVVYFFSFYYFFVYAKIQGTDPPRAELIIKTKYKFYENRLSCIDCRRTG